MYLSLEWVRNGNLLLFSLEGSPVLIALAAKNAVQLFHDGEGQSSKLAEELEIIGGIS